MIVKALGRRGSFAVSKSLMYVSKDQKMLTHPDGSKAIFKHNVFGKTLSEVEREFMDNEKRRLHPRSNNIKVMHCILSFSPTDYDKLDVVKLEDMTRKYIELFNPNAMYFATVHEAENLHVHLVISPTDIMGNSIRISRESFEELKINLQEYQKEKYPELEASVVEHGAEEKDYDKPDYWQKDDDIPKKELLRQAVNASFDLSHNRQEFFDLLSADGLTTYSRAGKVVGVEAERNYRFKTLGFDVDELDRREERLNQLLEITEEQEPIIKQVDEVEQIELNEIEVKRESELSDEEKKLNELDELSER